MFALVVLAGVGAFLVVRARAGVSTDDAFVKADIVTLPAEVGGSIVEVAVVENQHVAAGDLLAVLDDTAYKLRVAQAQANLDAATADARRAEEGVAAARTQVQLAEIQGGEATRQQKLQERLASGGAAVPEAVERAAAAQKSSSQAVIAARKGLDAAEAALDAARTRVPAAQAALDLANRDLEHTRVVAPISGFAAKVSAAVGEMTGPGQPLMAIVPDHFYVVANFKETDLAAIHVGDPVEVELDAYPDQPLSGKVESLGAGTGAAFSLLPADNASGNFVKVVQRVPVRIAIDAQTVHDRPLTVGLSANVTVPRARTGT